MELRAADGTTLLETRFRFSEPLSEGAFLAFAAQYPQMHVERDGDTVVMTPPQGNLTELLNAELVRLVGNWNAELQEPGGVFGSSTLFGPPDRQFGPDCAWASAGRLAQMKAAGQTFSELVPEIIFELRSPTDAWSATTAKCRLWQTLGARSALGIDPIDHRTDLAGEPLPEALLSIARKIAGIDS